MSAAATPDNNERETLQWHRLWLGLWITALVALLLLCLLPMPQLPLQVDHLDKLEHLLAYALLSAYAVMLFASADDRRRAAGGLLALGVLIELAQGALPWRSADVLDVIANTLGVAVGQLVALTPLRRTLHWLERVLRASA